MATEPLAPPAEHLKVAREVHFTLRAFCHGKVSASHSGRPLTADL